MDYRELFKESNKEVEERFLLTRERIGEMAASTGWHESIGRGPRRPDTTLGEDHGPAGNGVLYMGEDRF